MEMWGLGGSASKLCGETGAGDSSGHCAGALC